MNKLWYLLSVSMILALAVSYHDRTLHQKYPNGNRKDVFFTALLILFLGICCGLRTWYNDTVTYIGIYNNITPTIDVFFHENTQTFAQGIGFAFLNSIIKTIGFSSQDYLMFYALITAYFYVRFVRNYSDNFPLSVFLMFTTGFYTFAFAAIKQCMATAICLAALDALFERKRLKYIILVTLASLFHPYSIVYLLLLLMDFRPLTWKTYLYIAVFTAVGFSLNSLIGTILDVTDMMGATYDASSFVGEGVNIFRVLVCFVPVTMMFLFGRKLFVGSNSQENIMYNMAMLNAMIMFVGLFGTANYFARLANYFLPAQVIILPWVFKKIRNHDRQTITFLCVVCYLGYFIYGNAIQRSFDSEFSKITLWQYITTLFGG